MLKIIQHRKIWFVFSGLLVSVSVITLAIWGLRLGIDFTGGSLLEVEFTKIRPTNQEVTQALADLGIGQINLQPLGGNSLIIKSKFLTEAEHQNTLSALRKAFGKDDEKNSDTKLEKNESGLTIEATGEATGLVGGVEVKTGSGAAETPKEKNVIEKRFEAVGPTIGEELQKKSLYAVFLVIVGIIIYVAWSFRKVSKPVASWKYGLLAIVALVHDVLITVGVFVLLGKFWGSEINSSFVAAILTVLGYSVNDTIVVFDRIRENLPRLNTSFEETVNFSINQTFARSIFTSFTTFLALLAIFFFGGASIRDFALALSAGVIIGTYSSIFLASPLLVFWEKIRHKERVR